ncbi:unnamed protein product, partial [Mesorhabditis spiculigera]
MKLPKVSERNIYIAAAVLFFIGLHVYTVFSILYDFKWAIFSIVILGLAHITWIYLLLSYVFADHKEALFGAISDAFEKLFSYQIKGFAVVPVALSILLPVGFLAWLLLDSDGNYGRLKSLVAIPVYIILCVIVSANPAKIKWRPVIGGFVLQIAVGIIVLRWSPGHEALSYLSKKVVGFLDFTKAGTTFNFGFIAAPPNICGMGLVFLYTSLQIIIYFAAVVSILNYFGIIGFILSKIAIVMQYTVGTTAAESLNAAACIFLGQTEAAILIEPALASMTESEVHAVMTAGFACIAGSLFSAYISFGAQPAYLLSATVMNASVSLAISKLVYPEIQQSRQKDARSFQFKGSDGKSLLQLVSEAACHSSRLVMDIGVNLIVYIALLAFLNEAVAYAGDCIGIADLSFNKLLGYCFFPLAYLMGASDAPDAKTQVQECLRVAELMGMKTVLNEFIAYQRLKEMVAEGTLKGARAQMIATYALCGFSNISTIGSQLGILGSMCPWRRGVFSKLIVRALFAGSVSCFVTASVAGILVSKPLEWTASGDSHCFDPNAHLGGNLTTTVLPSIFTSTVA